MKNNSWFLLITIIISAAFTGCYNQTLPDESGRVCEPNVMLVDSYGCLPGCDLDASAYFCTADGRGQECRIVAGRVCRTDPGCPGGGAGCEAGVGACFRSGVTSCPAGSSVPSVCSAVAGTPGAEICRDGIDNDCDGTADDGCPTCVATGPEICDNLDNDCVGGIDNGCDDDNDDHCDSGMSMGASGSLACPRTPPGRTVGDDCDDTNPGRCPTATEICGNGIDEDCNGSDLVCTCTTVWHQESDRDGFPLRDITMRACSMPAGYGPPRADGRWDCNDLNASVNPGAVEICGNGIDEDCSGSDLACTCTYRGAEVCGNGIDDDCVGGDLACGPTCGFGALVGSEICVEYSGSVPSIATVGGVAVTSPSIAIFNCAPGGISSFAPGTSSCIPLNESCFGWLATTATQGTSADERNFTSWDGYMGRSATSMGIRVFARTGSTVRELSALSWIANDPTGGTYSSYVPAYTGRRYVRLMVPVREDCAVSTARPPDHY